MSIFCESSKEQAAQRLQHEADAPVFNMAGVKTFARVVSVYDGDTLHVVMPFADKCYRFPVRIAGIDTCEMRSKKAENKALAIKARNRVIDLVTEGAWNGSETATKKQIEAFFAKQSYLVWMECKDLDKYGRVLASIHSDINGPSFADILLEERLAYVYGGDTKMSEDEQTAELLGEEQKN